MSILLYSYKSENCTHMVFLLKFAFWTLIKNNRGYVTYSVIRASYKVFAKSNISDRKCCLQIEKNCKNKKNVKKK